MATNQIFVSYSPKDKLWLGRLQTHLAPWGKEGTAWSDEQIQRSSNWKDQIVAPLEEADPG
jgi:hypothetical protein